MWLLSDSGIVIGTTETRHPEDEDEIFPMAEEKIAAATDDSIRNLEPFPGMDGEMWGVTRQPGKRASQPSDKISSGKDSGSGKT